ncbi:MAG: hypothetical protein LBE56_00795 [Tannerella sp.]|jgi:hypothetical protein|nr:hypothetical protein [Tannerella sp.]
MKFEEYIKNLRSRLDTDEPDEDFIWQRISHSMEKQTKQKQSHRLIYAFLAAAMIIIAFTVGYNVRQVSAPNLIFVKIDPKLARQEAELVKQIGTYTQQIEQENVDLDELVTTPADLEDIDRLIDEYSVWLKQYGANPELIETLLNLYETKVMLLKRILNEIEKDKEYEKVKSIL